MGSNYFGDLNLGNEISSSTNNCSRKGKKSSTEKLKQPQRGLGVAQLEKIRLHSQMGSSNYLPPSNHPLPFPSNLSQEDIRREKAYSSSPSFSYSYSPSSSSFGFKVQHQSFMVGLSEMGNIVYPDSVHRTPTSRWNHGNDIVERKYLIQPNITRHLRNQQEEDFIEKRRKKDNMDSMSSSSRPQGGNQELDLELRLSL